VSDAIGHECGIALVRLKKPLPYYREKYGSGLWGLKKTYLLMEKQRNRGQDGAGVGVIKLGMPPGAQYFHRHREAGAACLDRLWKHIHDDIERLHRDIPGKLHDDTLLKQHCHWVGEIFLGHLRYGTHGGNSTDVCHPFVRASNWPSRYLSVAGNFNLTNTHELFEMLVGLGQHPIGSADTSTVMEKIGHFLDEANEGLIRKLRTEPLDAAELATRIATELDVPQVLRRASKSWDGGYHICGIIGHGVAFALRDPNGIRPAFCYENDEVVAVASERVALVTCFDVGPDEVREIAPGHALVINHRGVASQVEIIPALERRSCSFERIYFSRGNDADIYRERKALGRELVPAMLKAIDYDLEHTVISYIPNTAETAYHGLLEGLEAYLAEWKEQAIISHQEAGTLTRDVLTRLLSVRPWQEKAALKDAKLRTFISDELDRNDLVSHAYDITRGILRPGIDNLVVIDDSIVRGTTLRQSILRMLMRLEPKRIVVLSSAPQIRYPDCYGIDMSELGKFIAFEAAAALLKERGKGAVLKEVYESCIAELAKPAHAAGHVPGVNHVKRIYAPFSEDEIAAKVAELVRPRDVEWTGDITVVYQTVNGLRWAIPKHTGDWYFTGDYPTPGGFRVVNRAYVNYFENRRGRAYEALG
jgi:amidophosphoribosyltransferase